MINQLQYKFKKSKRTLTVLFASGMVGILSALLADTLKVITEHYEHDFLTRMHDNRYLIFLMPLIGFSTIYVLRHFLFRNKPNLGIKEVLDAIKKGGKTLPAYKIPSHYFNGFLTVIFGGSTGIEVSTVVATAAIGGAGSQRVAHLRKYKTDLICSGLAAGVTALFNAPIAGFLFAYEVFAGKRDKMHVACLAAAVSTSYLLTKYFFYKQLFSFEISVWHKEALPYFVVLGVFAGCNAVLLTKSVLLFKKVFAWIKNDILKITIGSLVVSVIIFFFPGIYGDGYPAIKSLTQIPVPSDMYVLLPLLAVLLLKPIATSVTLGAGGDGGVFAPSLFIGAFLGLLVSMTLNHFFHLGLIPLNFIVIGMAAVLSGSIHAPFTAIFLVCALVDNYVLFVPVLIACLVSRFIAHFLYPYTVYTYKSPAIVR